MVGVLSLMAVVAVGIWMGVEIQVIGSVVVMVYFLGLVLLCSCS